MPIPEPRRLRQIVGQAVLPVLLVIACTLVTPGAKAAPAAASQAAAKRVNSTMDGELFYKLFLSELELARGEPGVAYQVILDAARRNKEDALFQRAVDVAIGARAGEQALSAAKSWRTTLPKSQRAAEVQAQLFMALGKPAEAGDALRAVVRTQPRGRAPRHHRATAANGGRRARHAGRCDRRRRRVESLACAAGHPLRRPRRDRPRLDHRREHQQGVGERA